MTTGTDLAYLAGLFDGEAYIGIKKVQATSKNGRRNLGYLPVVSIRMVDERAIILARDAFGGCYTTARSYAIHGRPLFQWQITCARAEACLRAVLPYLRIKREQAENALALRDLQRTPWTERTEVVGTRTFTAWHGHQSSIPTRAFTAEHMARLQALHERSMALNH